MKTKMLKLLLAACMLGLPIFQNAMSADPIRVTKGPKGSNKDNEFPHRDSGCYSDLAFAYYDTATGLLSITFNAEADNTSIYIYQNDTLIIETTRSIYIGDVVTFDLSAYGTGDYQIVITDFGDEDLYGYLSVEYMP